MTGLAVAMSTVLGLNSNVQADEVELAPEIARPLLIVNLASVDRAMERMEYIFQSVDRPDLIDTVKGFLTRARDLKGLDRKRPMGLMVFLQEGLIPIPLPVGYVPVEDFNELISTAALAQMKITKSAEKDDMYELLPRNGEKQYIRLLHNYAFISNNPETLDREFVDPAQFAAPLNNKYDICISANLKVTPKPIKQLLLSAIRLTTQTEMQRRDTEAEAAYRIRKANAESNLRFVENILQYGEELTIGGKVDPEKKRAYVDLVVRATPDSDFAKELTAGSPKPSYFAAVIDATVPLTFSISTEVSKLDKKTLKELFSAGSVEANRAFAKLPPETLPEDIPQLPSLKDLFGSLEATIEEGHLDGFFQFMGETGEKFVFIGGVRLVGGQRFGVGVRDVLIRIKANANDVDIALSVDAHHDVIFHRITPENRGRGERQLYGDEYSFYLGTDNNSLWFAIGGDKALPTLKAAIDKVEASKSKAPKRGENIPFQLIFNTSRWIQQQASSRPDGQPGRFGRFALQAFEEEGSDIIRLDARPIENGFRLRAQFENGWLKLVGNGIARAIGGGGEGGRPR
jgi:hypothetical protein